MTGSSRFVWRGPDLSELEIGWTFLARSHWGGAYNGEMKRLMLDHAFQMADHVVFLIGATNFRSQRAVEKIGGFLTDRGVQKSPNGSAFDFLIFEIRKPQGG